MEKILNVLLKNLINHIPSMPTLFLVEKKKKKKKKKKNTGCSTRKLKKKEYH